MSIVNSAGAPPPRPGRKQPDSRGGSRDRRDFRPQQQVGSSSNTNNRGGRDRRPEGNKKFGGKSDWNSQGGGSGGQWGNNWNNYGNQGIKKKFSKYLFLNKLC